MSMNYTSTPQGLTPTGSTASVSTEPALDSGSTRAAEGDGSLFAATPVWERSGKKRRGARTVSTTHATPAALAAEASPAMAAGYDPALNPGVTTETAARSEALHATPPRTRTVAAQRANGPAVALAAGVVALGGLAAAGFYASQPRDRGVAELSPGEPSELAALEAATTAPLSAITAPPPRATSATQAQADARTPAPVRTAAAPRNRPAVTAAAAGDVGLDASASATLPTGPMPYSSMNGGDTAASPTAATDTPAALTPAPSTTPTVTPAPSIAPDTAAPDAAPATGADSTVQP
jgi:hypothetical protein